MKFLYLDVNQGVEVKLPVKCVILRYYTATFHEDNVIADLYGGIDPTSILLKSSLELSAVTDSAEKSDVIAATVTDAEKTFVVGLGSTFFKPELLRYASKLARFHNAELCHYEGLTSSEVAIVKSVEPAPTSNSPEVVMDVYSTRLKCVVGSTTLSKLAGHTLKEMSDNNLVVKRKEEIKASETKVLHDIDNLDTNDLSGLRRSLYDVMVKFYGYEHDVGTSLSPTAAVTCPDCGRTFSVLDSELVLITSGDVELFEIQCQCGATLAVSREPKEVLQTVVHGIIKSPSDL